MKLDHDENKQIKEIELQSLTLTDSAQHESKENEDEEFYIQPSKIHIFNIFELIFAYISLFALNYPKLACFTVTINLLVIAVLVNFYLENAPDISKIIEHDYSGIRSKYDLHAGTIDHWCLAGGDGGCHCNDPLVPEKKQNTMWLEAFDENLKGIQTALDNWGEGIDVVFLGANIVEYWTGRTLGRTTSNFAIEVSREYDDIFGDGQIKALPLGIAGDTVSNILWRLQNGEMPDNLRPKIWWLIIGDNDIAIMQCSEEVVLIGILRIIEEILNNQPDAMIVINSMLPMTSDGRTPKINLKNKKNIAPHLTKGGGRRILQEGTVSSVGNKTLLLHALHKPISSTIAIDGDSDIEKQKLVSDEEQKRELKWDKKKNDDTQDNEKKGKPKNGWKKWGGKNDAGKKTVDEEIGNEYFASTTGEMKPSSNSYFSLWRSVNAINLALKKFSWSHNQVKFFDSTYTFIEENKIVENLMLSVQGQPSVAGHRELLLSIKQEIKNMFHKMEIKKQKNNF